MTEKISKLNKIKDIYILISDVHIYLGYKTNYLILLRMLKIHFANNIILQSSTSL